MKTLLLNYGQSILSNEQKEYILKTGKLPDFPKDVNLTYKQKTDKKHRYYW